MSVLLLSLSASWCAAGTTLGGVDMTPDNLVALFSDRARQRLSDAALPPDGFTPVGVRQELGTAGLGGVSVEFCRVEFAQQKKDPARVPFHHNLMTASGCEEPKNRVAMSVAALLPAVAHQEGPLSHLWSGLPRGVALHMARCGSTAVANMIAAAPRTVLLSEPRFIFDALVMGGDERLSSSELTVLLRLLAQLTTSGAVELLQRVGALPQGTGAQLFLKMQSNTPLVRPVAGDNSSLISLQTAWPDAAWAFIFRQPLEVVVAQLAVHEGSSTVVEDAEVSELLALSRIPCLGSRSYPGPFIKSILDETGIANMLPPSMGPAALTAEAYCAAHTGALLKAALNFSVYLQERKQNCIVAEHSPSAPGCSSMIFIDHAQLHNGIVGQHGLLSHFGIDVTGDKALDKVVVIGRRNAKNSSVSLAYTDDSDQKRRKASVAATVWSELFAQPLFNAVRDAAVACSRTTLSELLGDDTYTCTQQLPPGRNRSPTSPRDATKNDDGVRDNIDISLGHQLMGTVRPTVACSYEPLPFGWPLGAFLHVSEKGAKSFVAVGTLIHLFIMN